MADGSVRYGLRARASCRPQVASRKLAEAEVEAPEAAAIIEAGLSVTGLTKAELKAFAGRSQDYLECRGKILQAWHTNPKQLLTAQACEGLVPPELAGMARDARQFLHEEGCINFGVLLDSEPDPASEQPAMGDDLLGWHIAQLVLKSDLQTMTEKKLRKQLEADLGLDLLPRKDFIRTVVTTVVSYMSAKASRPDTPLPEVAQHPQGGSAKEPVGPKGRVIVIGAGPAGLAAASHLQRCGMETLVLEARDQVGGRVCTQACPGFSAPLDLGASIITGTRVDVDKGLRPDPSAIIARQLGLELHQLDTPLPLYDGATGLLVPQHTDTRVERLRDALLDSARERVEELGEAAVEGQTLGEAIADAFRARLAALEALPSQPEASADPAASNSKPHASHGSDPPLAGSGQAPAEATAEATPPNAPATPAEPPGSGAAPLSPDPFLAPPQATRPSRAVQAEHPEAPVQGGKLHEESPEPVATAPGVAILADAVAPDQGPAGPSEGLAGPDGAGGQGGFPGPDPSVPIPGTGVRGDDQLGAGFQAAASGRPNMAAAGLNDQALHDSSADQEATRQAEEAGPEASGAGTGPTSRPAPEPLANGHAQIGTDIPSVLSPPDDAPAVTEDQPGDDEPELQPADWKLSEAELRLLHWHWANLEYGCSAPLNAVSLAHWNQDEEYAGFGGPHCMVKGGYGAITAALASGLPVRLSCPVARISDDSSGVHVTLADGEMVHGQAVIVTVPLGPLQQGALAFEPPLPSWKTEAIRALGYGNLNKVVLEFEAPFWDTSVDFFGAAIPPGEASSRGLHFMFWSLLGVTGIPILVGLISGQAAHKWEGRPVAELQEAAMKVLHTLFGQAATQPVASTASAWASEPHILGSYSYVAAGASARTYDELAKPVRRRLLFAGEHTCKEHPDTVGGAMLTGVREAVRALHLLRNDSQEAAAEAATMVSAEAHKPRKGMGKPKRKEAMEADADDGSLAAKPRKKRRPAGEAEELEGLQKTSKKRAAASQAEQGMSYHLDEAAEEAARAVARNTTVALVSAGAGSCGQLLALMHGAAEPAEQGALLRAILGAKGHELARIGADVDCVAQLQAWMEASVQLGQRSEGLPTLLLLIKVLRALPPSWQVLEAADVPNTVFYNCQQAPKEARSAAAALCKHWALALREDPKADAPAMAAIAEQVLADQGPGKKEEASAARLDLQDPAVAERLEGTAAWQQLQAARAAAEERAAQQAALEAREMEEIQALQRQQSALAVEAARLAAAAQQARQTTPSSAAMSFEEFQVKNGGAPDSPEDTLGGPSHPPPASRKHRHSSSSSREQTQKQLVEFVHATLKPRYQAHQLPKEAVKWVASKTAHKILERDSKHSAKELLSSRRKGKVVDLINKYVGLWQAQNK